MLIKNTNQIQFVSKRDDFSKNVILIIIILEANWPYNQLLDTYKKQYYLLFKEISKDGKEHIKFFYFSLTY